MIAGLLYLSSIKVFQELSDGLVTLESASYIEKVCRREGIDINTLIIEDGHHEVFSEPRILEQIISKLVMKDKSREEETERC